MEITAEVISGQTRYTVTTSETKTEITTIADVEREISELSAVLAEVQEKINSKRELLKEFKKL